MLRIARHAARGALALMAGAILYLAAAVAGGLLPNDAHPEPPTNDLYRVGLVAGPIHTDLLIPLTPALRARLAFAAKAGVPVQDPAAEWLIVGWGARTFYTSVESTADVGMAAVWRGVTGDASVMRLDVAGRIADFDGVDLLALTPAQYTRLTNAVLADFAPGPDGQPITLPDAGFTLTDRFFAANDRFHLFRTCNVWISAKMAQAGVPFGRWTPTPFSVRLALWRFVPG